MKRPPSLQKILIVRLGSLGDIVHTLPAQQMLHHCPPESRLHWLAEPHYGPLLTTVPGIERIWLADTKKWRRDLSSLHEMISLARQLRKERYDVALDFQGLLKSSILTRLAGPRRILGFARERFKEPGATWFYDLKIPGEGNLNQHVIACQAELVRALGCETDPDPLIPFRLPDADREFADRLLDRLQISAPLLLHPGAGWNTKIWPPHDFAELALRLSEQEGLPVIVTGGPGEREAMAEIQSRLRPDRVPCVETTILQFAALCRMARLVVASDTGPLHLAVALGTPTVALIGPTSEVRNGPFNARDTIVKRSLPCSNCYRRSCDQFICMNLPVREVVFAVKERLAKESPTGVHLHSGAR